MIFAEIPPLARADAKLLTVLERGDSGHHYAIIRCAHLVSNFEVLNAFLPDVAQMEELSEGSFTLQIGSCQ
ncbi:MAG: hypothetical protein H8E15_16530 [Planctomycetes bacterium]|nr:hypothetical protein [Planctomycetota bacterium]